MKQPQIYIDSQIELVTHYINFHAQYQANQNNNIQTFNYVIW